MAENNEQVTEVSEPAVPFERADIAHLTGVERAAIFMMYLDEDVARHLFSQFSEEEIRQIGEAIARMDHVDANIVQTVIAEFARELGQSLSFAQGDAYLRSVLPNVLGKERAHRMLRSMEQVSRESFQNRFSHMQPGALAARLCREHPQTIAVACSVLGPELSAAVLAAFEPELQVQVALRLARLTQFPVELLEDIEALLGDTVDTRLTTVATDGGQMVAEIMNKLTNEDREELLASLSQRDESIASEISRQMFTFELLCTCDDKGIQNLLKEVERKDLATALKGADQATKDKFYENMSQRAGDYLKDDMLAMGPVRISEVEAAQQQIIALALRLEEEGKLIFMGSGEALVE
ncbi:MAG: flagellar motor switch protein FliG [Myxococcota bacterium]|nr:flagellar motor switch protein FliG [Myxococcota bacterium]